MTKTLILKISTEIIQKIERDYNCTVTPEKLLIEYSPEIPTEKLLPKLYDGAIVVSVNLVD